MARVHGFNAMGGHGIAPRIVRAVLAGHEGAGAIRRALGRVSEQRVCRALKRLVEAGLLARDLIPSPAASGRGPIKLYRYAVTEAGRAAFGGPPPREARDGRSHLAALTALGGFARLDLEARRG